MLSEKNRSHSIALPIDSILSKKRSVTVRIVTSGRPDVVFFAGFGNEGRSLTHIVKLLEAQGIRNFAVVGPLPYWHVSATAAAVKALGITGAAAAAKYIREQYKISLLHVIAESQTAGALMHAAVEYPHIFNGNIALLRPLGLTKMTRKEFKKGLRSGLFHPDQVFDMGVWPVGIKAAWRVLQDQLRHGGEQFNLGITWDSRRELKQLYARKSDHLRVFAAKDDKLYPAEAIAESLGIDGMSKILEVIPGIHASPASRAGNLQVAHTIRWCKSNLARP
ncbi:MAG TPA: hypothetical protein VF733_04690 [Candidatus Saccharimonadales bacterium]